MKGVVALIKKGIGKIVLDNKETPILNLPDSFEDGDLVEAEFESGNLEKPKTLVAYSKEKYFGTVIGDFEGRGIILTTYPKLIGTILFKGNFRKKDAVEFRLKKTKKIQAIDVRPTKELYKCFTPSFGVLEKRVLFPKTGVVEEVATRPKNVIEGKIKSVGKKEYGFIRSKIGDVFFLLSDFEKVYKKLPQKGDEVIFEYFRAEKGFKARKFFESFPELPLGKKFLIIEGKKMPLFVYENFYKKPPQAGDVVNYIENDGEIEFLQNSEPVEKIFFIKDERGDFYKGKIDYIKEDHGFIASQVGRVSFSVNSFKKFYEKEPKKGKTVFFRYVKGEKGLRVKSFVVTEFEVSKKAFKNFAKKRGF